jgi:phage-related protein
VTNLPKKAAVKKDLKFRGSSQHDLRKFPEGARRDAGYQLDRVQNGLDPEDFKPMSVVGHGVQEIRIKDEAGIFRVMYVAKFEDAVYVLHCFQKKTQRTAKSDLDLAGKRYAELVKEQNDER